MSSMTPPARVLAAVILVASVATCPLTSRALGVACGVALACIALLRPPAREFCKRYLGAGCVVAAVLAPLAITASSLGFVHVALRAACATAVALAFAGSLRRDELAESLRALGVPVALATLIDTMLRQVTAIADTGRRLTLARRLRGARGLRFGAETLSTLLIASATRAERTELAMRLRGYPADRDQAGAAQQSGRAVTAPDLPWLLLALAGAATLHFL